jgi:hypothetical protein
MVHGNHEPDGNGVGGIKESANLNSLGTLWFDHEVGFSFVTLVQLVVNEFTKKAVNESCTKYVYIMSVYTSVESLHVWNV